MINCIICNGNLVETVTNYMVDLDGNRFLIIKNVPCMKCSQCGEISYSDDVMQNLEKVISHYRQDDNREVNIVEYTA